MVLSSSILDMRSAHCMIWDKRLSLGSRDHFTSINCLLAFFGDKFIIWSPGGTIRHSLDTRKDSLTTYAVDWQYAE